MSRREQGLHKRVTFLVTDDEFIQLESLAKQENKNISEYIRNIALTNSSFKKLENKVDFLERVLTTITQINKEKV